MFSKNKPYFMIFPTFLFFTLTLGLGISSSLFQSINFFDFDFSIYFKLFNEKSFWLGLFLTLKISIISTFLSLIISMFCFYLLYLLKIKGVKKYTLIQKLFQIPLFFPYLLAGFLIFILFSQSGFISRLSFCLNLTNSIEKFPILVNDVNSFGIISAYIWKTSSFILLMIFPVLIQFKLDAYYLAKVCSYSDFCFFKEIILKYLKKPIIESILIIFCFTISDFEIPYLLGQSYPKTLCVNSFLIYTNGEISDRLYALCINNCLLFIVFLVLLISRFFIYGRHCK